MTGDDFADPAQQFKIAVAVLFVMDGAVFGSWAARIPDVSSHVGATPATLGTALFCISLGALLSMQVTGALCARLGVGPVATVAAALVSLVLVLPGLAGTVGALGATLLLFGAFTGALNVAANSLGVQLQRQLDRPVLSKLHAGFSFGGLAGALTGAMLSGVLSVAHHLTLVALAALVVTAAVAPILLASPQTSRLSSPQHFDADAPPVVAVVPHAPPRGKLPYRRVVTLLGVIAGCTAFAEGALTDWGALHLRELQAGPALAASGYAAFCLAMGCGRLAGHRVIVRFGDTRVLVLGSLTAAAGLLAAGLIPQADIALGGFVLIGLGLANIFPLAIARAGLIAGSRGVALASVVGYSGLLGGPPAIGLLAATIGLSLALSSICALALMAAVLALVVDAELPRAATVAAALRAQARTHLAPLARQAGSVARRQAEDLVRRSHCASVASGGRASASPRKVHPGLDFVEAWSLR